MSKWPPEEGKHETKEGKCVKRSTAGSTDFADQHKWGVIKGIFFSQTDQ